MPEAISEQKEDREAARAECIKLTEELALQHVDSRLWIGSVSYSPADMLRELQNKTPIGEELVDMHLKSQRLTAEMEAQRTSFDRLRNAVAGFARRIRAEIAFRLDS